MRIYAAAVLLAAISVMLQGCGGNMGTKTTGFSGEDITSTVEILRDRFTKTATVQVNEDTQWALYAGPAVDEIDLREPVEAGKADGEFPVDVDPAVRSFFQAVTPDGKAILAERVLPMAGGFNFRDLGGYRMQDGRYVKWGKLLRSDEMNCLTEEDLVYLASVPLRSVVDFRSEDEISKAPDRLPASVEHHYAYSISPGNLAASMVRMPNAEQGERLMEQMNRILVSDPEVVSQYRRFFELLADGEQAPVLFHCTAGKDRTGIAAALILYALGADDRTVMNDYLLSREYSELKYQPIRKRFPDLAPLLTVGESYLGAALDEIRSRYGSVEQYLTDILQVDTARLRELYLY
ncbi:MAG: tyrosine-protein phosphatase [Alistipes sp.]|nr:tyrosine-protein phosphatase [Alistipes sp.]